MDFGFENETGNEKAAGPKPAELLSMLSKELQGVMVKRLGRAAAEEALMARLERHADVLDTIFLQMAALGSRRERHFEMVAALRAQAQHLHLVREYTKLKRDEDGKGQPNGR